MGRSKKGEVALITLLAKHRQIYFSRASIQLLPAGGSAAESPEQDFEPE